MQKARVRRGVVMLVGSLFATGILVGACNGPSSDVSESSDRIGSEHMPGRGHTLNLQVVYTSSQLIAVSGVPGDWLDVNSFKLGSGMAIDDAGNDLEWWADVTPDSKYGPYIRIGIKEPSKDVCEVNLKVECVYRNQKGIIRAHFTKVEGSRWNCTHASIKRKTKK